MTSGTEVLGAVLLTAETMATLVVAWRLARRIIGPDPLDRLVVVTLLALVQVVGIPLLLACVDLLGRWPVLVLHLVVLGVTLVVTGSDPDGEPLHLSSRPLAAAAVGVVAGFALLWARLSLKPGPSADYDSREYHIANLASWFQRHNIWHLPYANPGYITATHPGNGELAALWAILPTGRDQLAYVTPLAFVFLGIVATAYLARQLGGSASAAAIVATAVVGAPIFFINDVRTIKTDEPAAAGLVLATALLLRYQRDRRSSSLVLAGLALGLGVGSKYTVVLPAALLIVIAVVMVKERARLLWALPGMVGLAGPWLLRNLVTTGNPIFPEQVALGGLTIFPGGVTTIDVFSTRLASHVLHFHTAVLRSWGRLARHLFGPAGLLPIAGVVLAWRRRSPAMVVAVLMALGATAAYLLTPFTGAGANGYVPLLGSNQRYLLDAVLLGGAVFAVVLPELVVAAVAAAVLAYDVWFEVERQTIRGDIPVGKPSVAVAVGAGVVVAGAVWLAPRVIEAWRPRVMANRAAVSAALAAAVAVVGVAGGFAVIRHLDHTSPTGLSVVLERIDGNTPIEVIGVGDLRSLVGDDLDRPLVLVAAGGRGNEEPFSDKAEVTNRYESGSSAVLPTYKPTAVDAVLGHKLDAALAAAGRAVLVVGPPTSISSPAGWAPDRRTWCLVAPFSGADVYARIGTPAAAACSAAAAPLPTAP